MDWDDNESIYQQFSEAEIESVGIEYENCQDCGADGDLDKDIGLDSTMSFSIKDGEFRRHTRIPESRQERSIS